MSKIRSRSGSGASAALCPRPGCGRNSHRSLELKSGFRSAFCSAISTVATSLLLRRRRDEQCVLLHLRLSYGRLPPPTWLVSPVCPGCIIMMLTSLLRSHTLGCSNIFTVRTFLVRCADRNAATRKAFRRCNAKYHLFQNVRRSPYLGISPSGQ